MASIKFQMEVCRLEKGNGPFVSWAIDNECPDVVFTSITYPLIRYTEVERTERIVIKLPPSLLLPKRDCLELFKIIESRSYSNDEAPSFGYAGYSLSVQSDAGFQSVVSWKETVLEILQSNGSISEIVIFINLRANKILNVGIYGESN